MDRDLSSNCSCEMASGLKSSQICCVRRQGHCRESNYTALQKISIKVQNFLDLAVPAGANIAIRLYCGVHVAMWHIFSQSHLAVLCFCWGWNVEEIQYLTKIRHFLGRFRSKSQNIVDCMVGLPLICVSTACLLSGRSIGSNRTLVIDQEARLAVQVTIFPS
jgi:hypothetical protein